MRVREWALWQLPRACVAYVLAVVLASPLLLLALAPGAPTAGQALVLLGCAAGPLVVLAAEMRLGQAKLRDNAAAQDQTELWLLAAVVAVPSPWALVVTVPVLLVKHLVRHRGAMAEGESIRRTHWHHTAFNTSQRLLSGAAAYGTFHLLGGLDAVALAGAAAAVVFVAAQFVLVTVAIGLASRDRRLGRRMLLDGIGGDLALAFAGVLLGIATAATPWALVLVAPLAITVQRALLHGVLLEQLQKDAKTGLASAPFWQASAQSAVSRAADRGEPVAVVLLDLDHFKQVNDQHGHLAGDEVLREVAARLQAALRPDDLAGRFGGEEFTVLLRGTSDREAHEVAERLRRAVGTRPVTLSTGVEVRVSCSAGVASARGSRDADEVIGAADAALFQAKRAGRDRVVLSSVPAPRQGDQGLLPL